MAKTLKVLSRANTLVGLSTTKSGLVGVGRVFISSFGWALVVFRFPLVVIGSLPVVRTTEWGRFAQNVIYCIDARRGAIIQPDAQETKQSGSLLVGR